MNNKNNIEKREKKLHEASPSIETTSIKINLHQQFFLRKKKLEILECQAIYEENSTPLTE